MGIVDKKLILARLPTLPRVALELGCGNRKHDPDSIGVDALDYECVDIVGDIFEVLGAMPDGTVDDVYSSHFLEHVSDVPGLLDELARILKPGGRLAITVPHFSNPYFYSDITHRASFGLYSMSYFSDDRKLTRKVPSYQKELFYELQAVRLVFKSSPPFYLRHALKKLVEVLVNINSYTKELYEEMFCHMFPCYEVQYELRRISGPSAKANG
jgi:ubiquinone/menaquinone biosynthesis C-methylase UbiE